MSVTVQSQINTYQPTFWGALGDALPSIRVHLLDNDGDEVVLGLNDTVTFSMWPIGGGTNIVTAAAATINDRPTGDVQYDLAAADVDEAGTYLAQFEVTWAGTGGKTTKFPRPRPMLVVIAPSQA